MIYAALQPLYQSINLLASLISDFSCRPYTNAYQCNAVAVNITSEQPLTEVEEGTELEYRVYSLNIS